ncbi:MAG: 16S rRNA (cytosine(1402)-N(4))-methyltransferase RsmH [Gemmatimonadota bacterium]
MEERAYEHVPVLAAEVLAYLRPERGGLFLDGTMGGGGHAAQVLGADSAARLVGLDRDPEAIEAAAERLKPYGDRVRLLRANFRDASSLREEWGGEALQGALLDLGVSSRQIDAESRGFSFRPGTPLSMRMGGTAGGGRTASALLDTASEAELGRIFREYGEERRWRALAREIVRRRAKRPFRVADDLVAAMTAVLGPGVPARHKARLFQALRIAVNDELAALEEGLEGIRSLLAPGGRLVVIAYHSLEDRRVKNAFREWSRSCVCPPGLPECRCRGEPLGRTLTRRPVRPGPEEVAANPRARSARLRAWERA